MNHRSAKSAPVLGGVQFDSGKRLEKTIEMLDLDDAEIDKLRTHTLQLRGDIKLNCNVFIIPADGPSNFVAVSSNLMANKFSMFSEATFSAIEISDCIRDYDSSPVILVVDSPVSDDVWFIVPKVFLDAVNVDIDRSNLWSLVDVPNVSLVGGLEQLYNVDLESWLFTIEDLEYISLRLIQRYTKKEYSSGELDIALEDLINTRNSDASIGGINTSIGNALLLGPALIFCLLWVIHRKMLRIDTQYDTFWLTTDCSDVQGILGATIYDILPYLLAVVAGLHFYSAVGTFGIYPGGYVVLFESDLSVHIYDTRPLGWKPTLTPMQVAAGFLWLVIMVLSLQVSIRLLGMTLDAARSNGPRIG